MTKEKAHSTKLEAAAPKYIPLYDILIRCAKVYLNYVIYAVSGNFNCSGFNISREGRAGNGIR
ncbi:hypothetical protein J2TS4_04710 [Paenibacillus sp. J2TS4]|nr:hypothetical protein J2TS4_04710 [Paenibacillus sp. J2TS4]